MYTALQTGVVNERENPISSTTSEDLRSQKYITMDGHIWSENLMVMNSKKFASLPVGAQQILLAGAKLGVAAEQRRRTHGRTVVKYESSRSYEGHVPTTAEKQKFREVAPARSPSNTSAAPSERKPSTGSSPKFRWRRRAPPREGVISTANSVFFD
jgi:TRAP-type C4-dicarboxylate transport system substrate-binding protein